MNFAACVVAAATGASRMTPIAGAGFSGQAWQEGLVAGMFASVGLAMTVAVILLCLALWRRHPLN